MARGGPRVGAGRPKKAQDRSVAKSPAPTISEQSAESVRPEDKKDPLAYMLSVMNDPDIDAGRRDRMAVAAAPYLHPKAGEAGKKEAKAEAAKKAGTGKFAPAAPPRLVVNNTV
jgi:hypothetical protein